MEDLKFFGTLIAVFVLLLIAVIFGVNLFMRAQCSDFALQTNRETKYNFLNGCLVKTDQGWIAGENLIVNSPTK